MHGDRLDRVMGQLVGPRAGAVIFLWLFRGVLQVT